jgi:hypothetical protein
MTKKRLDDWMSWSLDHLNAGRVDPFLQGWRCAFASIMAADGIPNDVRKKICAAMSYAESRMWTRTRKARK